MAIVTLVNVRDGQARSGVWSHLRGHTCSALTPRRVRPCPGLAVAAMIASLKKNPEVADGDDRLLMFGQPFELALELLDAHPSPLLGVSVVDDDGAANHPGRDIGRQLVRADNPSVDGSRHVNSPWCLLEWAHVRHIPGTNRLPTHVTALWGRFDRSSNFSECPLATRSETHRGSRPCATRSARPSSQNHVPSRRMAAHGPDVPAPDFCAVPRNREGLSPDHDTGNELPACNQIDRRRRDDNCHCDAPRMGTQPMTGDDRFQ